MEMIGALGYRIELEENTHQDAETQGWTLRLGIFSMGLVMRL